LYATTNKHQEELRAAIFEVQPKESADLSEIIERGIQIHKENEEIRQ
jgi:hypothetical protein